MRMQRVTTWMCFVGVVSLSSIGCESPSCCRAPQQQYPPTYYPSAPVATPPAMIPETLPPAGSSFPGTTMPTPLPPPKKLPTNFGSSPTISPPTSSGPVLPKPTNLGGANRAPAVKNEAPLIRLGQPEFPLLQPPVAVDNEIPRAEIIGIYGWKDGKPVPAHDEKGNPLPLPPGVGPDTVPGVIPLPPGSDLPPLPTPAPAPEKKPEPKRAVPFHPERTA